MPIINTKGARLRRWAPVRWLLVACLSLSLGGLAACSQRSNLDRAREYVRQSADDYQAAVALYQGLIKKGKDLDKLYFELGKLYYDHGDFLSALSAFKGSQIPAAKKFMAISCYRLGNFRQALEIFNKQKIADDEYLYYKGLSCEKLNLFDEALKAYAQIKTSPFKEQAKARANLIEKEASLANIKDLDRKVYKIVADAPSGQQYPQAGALILYCDEKIDISTEGTQLATLHYIVKILNERGKEGFSETHLDYDSTYENVELEYARTILADGRVAEVGSRHIRDVSKYLNFPLYSNARVYIISFPEVSEGAVIEYKVKIHRNQLINKNDFVSSYPVQASEPVILANFSVSLPKDKPLQIKVINDKYNDFSAALSPDKEEKDGRLSYRWQFKEIPQIIPEANMPASVEINPTLLLSTFSSWQDIYNWWWRLAEDKIKPDKDIQDKVAELTKGMVSDEEKARAIYNFCAQKIRYVAVEYGQAGYEPHYAYDIFKNKYGDCKDKAILLVAMLKEAKLNAWPVLIATKQYYNLQPDFPAVLFNHCIASVWINDKTVFFDPTAQTCSFGDLPSDDQGRKVLVFSGDGYKIGEIPFYPAGHNQVKQELKLWIDPDESIQAQKAIYTYGLYDQAQRYWLLYTQPELIQEALKEEIQQVSIGAKLDEYSIKNLEDLNQPVVLEYSFSGPEYFTLAGALRIMPQLSQLDTALVAKDKRRYPVDFDHLSSDESVLRLEIPPEFVVRYLPENVSADSRWLKFFVEYKPQDKGVYFRQKMELKTRIIPQAEYVDFRKFFIGLAKRIKQRIVLEKK